MMDWADLDGNLLISNDRFDGMKIVDGHITLPTGPASASFRSKAAKQGQRRRQG